MILLPKRVRFYVKFRLSGYTNNYDQVHVDMITLHHPPNYVPDYWRVCFGVWKVKTWLRYRPDHHLGDQTGCNLAKTQQTHSQNHKNHRDVTKTEFPSSAISPLIISSLKPCTNIESELF